MRQRRLLDPRLALPWHVTHTVRHGLPSLNNAKSRRGEGMPGALESGASVNVKAR